ncbi:MAG: NAD(P)/FAD-dependent oxidoreductase [Deltaproteobacteria bacterium]|nr:NAD(P)/FAD-dependent oxidoreductase [Deltaproteobacteria bacterium]
MPQHHSIVIVGGGTAGITVAARLRRAGVEDVAVIEPSKDHDYQPLWTLVGAGVFPLEHTRRDEARVMPSGVAWLRDSVVTFEPESRKVLLASGEPVTYDQLVVAPGIQLDWHKIEGLQGHLGTSGIVSNYLPERAPKTWEAIHSFGGGNAVFHFPPVPIKCAGAPQKIIYLADEAFRRQGVRDRTTILWMSASAGIFGIKRYVDVLQHVVERKGIEAHDRENLVAVRAASREAVFHHLDTGAERIVPFKLLHVVPPQSAPDFIKKSPLADKAGWVDVDKHTMQHVRYPDVFSLGDASSLPTSRTGAAIRKEAPVMVANLLAHRRGEPLVARYDGYTSCPVVTGYGKLVLAEFDYDGNPVETFPFNQAKERWSMYQLKAHLLPQLYWHGMLKGLA